MELPKLEQMAFNQLMLLEKTYEKEIKAALVKTLNTIRADMARIYEKYAKEGKLTRVEMTKYNKYMTMEKQMMDKLDEAIKKNLATIKRLSPHQYNEAFFHYAWAMDNGNGVRLAYGIQNMNNITELFSITNPKNIEMANALKNYGPTAKKFLRNALLKNMAMGKSYATMMKDIKDALNKTSSQAMRIVRTEGQRAISKGQDDLYIQAKMKGIEGKVIWDATLDARTRPSHAKMDGVEKSDDGLFYGLSVPTPRPVWEGLPPEESINCRCHERFEVDGYSPQLRRTRDQGVIPYQKYDDWKKTYGVKLIPRKTSVTPSIFPAKIKVPKAPAAVKIPKAPVMAKMPMAPPIIKPIKVPAIPQPTIPQPIQMPDPMAAPQSARKFGDVILPKEMDAILKYNTTNKPIDKVLMNAGLPANEIAQYDKVVEYLNKAVPIKNIHSEDWKKVLSDGMLRNQFETKTSNGALSKASRDEWEEFIAGRSVSNMDKTVRPKYGSMFPDINAQRLSTINYRTTNQYGEIVLEFKKDVVDRATLTLGNSSGQQGAFTKNSPQKAFDLGHSTFRAGDVLAERTYMEMQIWGTLSLDDVAKVWLPKRLMATKALTEAAFKQLGVNIPIELF